MGINQLEGFMTLTLFMGYLYLWRSKRKNSIEQNGHDPDVIHRDNRPTQKFFSYFSRLMSIFIIGIIILHILGVNGDIANTKIPFGPHIFFNLIGYAFGLAGLSLCWCAQREMGLSWRVGIDSQKKTELITTGVFEKIRNPTYSGLFMICLGALFILHSTLMFVWVAMFYISIEFQVRLEEEFLIENHANLYEVYYQKTKRYIPSVY